MEPAGSRFLLPVAGHVVKTCAQCGGTFEADIQFCPRDGTPLRLPQGLVAGKYEVLSELGKGGMGVVFLANQVAIDRRCALKMLRADAVADPDALARFHREARSASRIQHPNVVAVFDFGQAEDGSAYLAMEFVDGRTLADVLHEGPLPPRRAARIAWQVANGLGVAHELGIVHRDLKPGNIMLTTYRSWTDFVKVVDFGIAKPVGAGSQSSVTSTGLRVGTPAYMSPEQWIDGNVDARSDLFTLALIVVEMLSGRTPPPQPSLMMDGTTLIESVPKTTPWPDSLKRVLSRALQRLPEDRYGSVAEFSRELVAAVNEWEPPAPGVREPWDERLGVVTPATTAVARPGRRSAVRAGIAAPVVALTGWFAWKALSGGLASPATPAATDSGGTSAPVSVDAPADSTARGAVSSLPGGLAPRQGGTPPRRDDGAARRAATPAVPSVDSLAIIRQAFDLDRPDADSARRVIAVAETLLRGPLGDSARVEVSYRLAEAHFFLGEDDAACDALSRVLPLSERLEYLTRSVATLRQRRCAPSS